MRSREVNDRFALLVGLSHDERAKKLEEIKAIDVELYRELRDLLADLQAAERSGFLATHPSESSLIDEAQWRGLALGPYRPIRILGHGGMGAVFLARQLEPIEREVALKVIMPDSFSPDMVQRLENERSALAQLSHDGIAHLYDFGEIPEGGAYLAMEYVPGQPVDQFCDQRRMTLEKRIRLVITLCGIVGYAHRRGVIHRDLKPDNILVRMIENEPRPKVIDFGIAKALGFSGANRLTRTGMVLGTAGYMSPEQASGASDIDLRTDVYALGAVLYQLLTGCQPYDSDAFAYAGPDGRRRLSSLDPAIMPSKRVGGDPSAFLDAAFNRGLDVTGLTDALTGDLDWIALTALAVDRDNRYQTPSELASDLERFLRQEPVRAHPPSVVYKTRRFFARHRGRILTAVLLFTLLALGFGIARTGLRQARQARKMAGEVEQKAVFQSEKADLALQMIDAMLSAADPHASGRDIRVLDLLDEYAVKIDTGFAGHDQTRATLRHILGRTYNRLGEYEKADRQLTRALEHRIRLMGESHVETLDTMLELTSNYIELGRIESAEAWALRALDLSGEILEPGDPLSLGVLLRFASLRLEQRRFDEAEYFLERLYVLTAPVYGEEHPESIAARANLGLVYLYQDRLKECEPLLLEAYETACAVLGETFPATLRYRHNIIRLLMRSGRKAEAEAEARHLYTLQARVLGEDHAFALGALAVWGIACSDVGRYNQAESLFLDLLERGKRIFGEGHLRLSHCYLYLGLNYYRMEENDKALDCFLTAMPIVAQHLGGDSARAGLIYFNLGGLYLRLGLAENARDHLETARMNFERWLTPNHPDIGMTLLRLARAYHDLDQPFLALESGELGLAILDASDLDGVSDQMALDGGIVQEQDKGRLFCSQLLAKTGGDPRQFTVSWQCSSEKSIDHDRPL